MKYDKDSIQKRKNRAEKINKILFIIIIILLYNLILLGVSYIDNVNIPSVFGYKAYSITTDSMKPTLDEGDIIITKQQQEDKIKQGDIITYVQNGEVITHRIIQIETQDGKNKYVTKGDNNTIEDSEKINYEQIEGVKLIKIPLLGNILNFMKDEIIVLIIILVVLILYFYKITHEEIKEERRKKKEIEDKKFKEKKENNF